MSFRRPSRTRALEVVGAGIGLGSKRSQELRHNCDPKVVCRVKLKRYIKAAAELNTPRVLDMDVRSVFVRIANGSLKLR